MKNYKTPEEYIQWIEMELEGANIHSMIELPRNLFNGIKNSNLLGGDEIYELELAKIIAEEFYRSI